MGFPDPPPCPPPPASWDETLKVWDVATGTVVHTFTGHQGKVFCVAVSPDGDCVISGGSGQGERQSHAMGVGPHVHGARVNINIYRYGGKGQYVYLDR